MRWRVGTVRPSQKWNRRDSRAAILRWEISLRREQLEQVRPSLLVAEEWPTLIENSKGTFCLLCIGKVLAMYISGLASIDVEKNSNTVGSFVYQGRRPNKVAC